MRRIGMMLVWGAAAVLAIAGGCVWQQQGGGAGGIDYTKACETSSVALDVAAQYRDLFAADPETADTAAKIDRAMHFLAPVSDALCAAAHGEQPADLADFVEIGFNTARSALMQISDPRQRMIALATLDTLHVALVATGVLDRSPPG